MFHVLSLCVHVFFRAASNSTSGWRSLRQGFVWSVCFWNTFEACVCVWFLCGFNTRSDWQEHVFRFPCALACNGCRRRTSVPGHLSRDSCTTQVLARPGFRFAQVVPSCHEVLPKLLRRQAGSSTSLPLNCLGHVCSACWVTFDGAGVDCVSIKTSTAAECTLPSRVCVLFRVCVQHCCGRCSSLWTP